MDFKRTKGPVKRAPGPGRGPFVSVNPLGRKDLHGSSCVEQIQEISHGSLDLYGSTDPPYRPKFGMTRPETTLAPTSIRLKALTVLSLF